ncbi:MAG: sigma-70 family RNA polymerase sigma factor [Acidobacteria bacterium]|nr:sigma-70 family RNA polymerase sigma factor [Acidobacteriota bacterium]
MQSSPKEITRLLNSWRLGDQTALNTLMPLVYDELHRIAHRYMLRERAGCTLQTTALVNEAYLRLVDIKEVEWRDKAHFLAISAKLMRQILVDIARSRSYRKRGGNATKVSLDKALLIPANHNLLEIDEALSAFSKVDPRKVEVVELRFYGGLSVKETAEVLKVSTETVKRDWRLAKVWLLRHLKGHEKEKI